MEAFLKVPNVPISCQFRNTVREEIRLFGKNGPPSVRQPEVPTEIRSEYEDLRERFENAPYECCQEMAAFKEEHAEILYILERPYERPYDNTVYLCLTKESDKQGNGGGGTCFGNFRWTGDPATVRQIDILYGGNTAIPVASIYPHAQGAFEPFGSLLTAEGDKIPSVWALHLNLRIVPYDDVAPGTVLGLEYDVFRIDDDQTYIDTPHSITYTHSWSKNNHLEQSLSKIASGNLKRWEVEACHLTDAIRIITTTPMKRLDYEWKNTKHPMVLTETRNGRYVYEYRLPERINFSKKEDMNVAFVMEAENDAEFQASVFFTSWNVLRIVNGTAGSVFC